MKRVRGLYFEIFYLVANMGLKKKGKSQTPKLMSIKATNYKAPG